MRQLHDEPDELRDRMLARAEEAAQELQGTARSLVDVSTEEERNNLDFCNQLDSVTLECDGCGWCETGEICANGHCHDCHNDQCEGDHDEEG